MPNVFVKLILPEPIGSDPHTALRSDLDLAGVAAIVVIDIHHNTDAVYRRRIH